MSYSPRRPRYNAGFQRKRPLIFAIRPTSRDISDQRLMSLVQSDPLCQQQNEPASANAVAMAKASHLGEDSARCPSSPSRRCALKRCHPTELPPLQKGPPYQGQGSLGFAENSAKPGQDRKITAPVWAVAGASGNAASIVSNAAYPRKRPEKMCLPPMAGHFPGVADLMVSQKWRVPTETPPGQYRSLVSDWRLR